MNLIAHFVESDTYDLLLRARTGKGGIKEIYNLPFKELDTDINMSISTTQTNEDKALGRHWVQTQKNKNKTYSKKTINRNWDFPSPYNLRFRVVRFQLDTGEYETLVTTLPRDKFSRIFTICAGELKHLFESLNTI